MVQAIRVDKKRSSDDSRGGHATCNALYATEKCHADNPKIYRALLGARVKAEQISHTDKAAAETCIRVEHSKRPQAFVGTIIEDLESDVTVSPQRLCI